MSSRTAPRFGPNYTTPPPSEPKFNPGPAAAPTDDPLMAAALAQCGDILKIRRQQIENVKGMWAEGFRDWERRKIEIEAAKAGLRKEASVLEQVEAMALGVPGQGSEQGRVSRLAYRLRQDAIAEHVAVLDKLLGMLQAHQTGFYEYAQHTMPTLRTQAVNFFFVMSAAMAMLVVAQGEKDASSKWWWEACVVMYLAGGLVTAGVMAMLFYRFHQLLRE